MSSNKHWINVPLVTIVLLFGVIMGNQTPAAQTIAPKELVLAAVQIESLFDGLVQRAEAKAEIDALKDEITAERGARQAAIAKMEEEFRGAADPDRREELVDAITLEKLKLQFWYQEAEAELEVEKALRLQHLYLKISEAIGELASAQGYDLVILDDSAQEPEFDRDSRIPGQVQILQQIASRKVLYRNPAIDITNDLITRMNNDFRARPSGP
ncbi:MAG: OmpH family outer membrane protein [Planctomycetes bacterium]|nr:OmpH family outer membrane protein [Planctomycetota bacterium]